VGMARWCIAVRRGLVNCWRTQRIVRTRTCTGWGRWHLHVKGVLPSDAHEGRYYAMRWRERSGRGQLLKCSIDEVMSL
jgi:hypothetical protein